MPNITNITPPRVPLTDPRTGQIAREWYMFLLNLFTLTGGGTSDVTILDLLNTPAPPDIAGLLEFTQQNAELAGPAWPEIDAAIRAALEQAQPSGPTPQNYSAAIQAAVDQAQLSGPSPAQLGAVAALNMVTTPYGGTGLATWTAGDLPYYTSGDSLSKLAIGTSTKILTSSGTAPQWSDPTAVTVGTATNLAGGAANRIPYQTGAGATSFIAAPTISDTYLNWSGAAFQWSANPLGTVTSVAMTVPSFLSVAGSPITTSGSLDVTLANQTANRIFAGPTTGVAAAPTFRALVSADMPASGAGSGTVTSVAQSFTGGLISVAGSPVTTSGTLALTVAGTSGGVPYFSSASTWASSAALTANQLVLGGGAGAAPAALGSLGTTTQLLHGNAGGAPTFGALVAGDISSNLIANSKLAQMTTKTLKGNSTAGTADPSDLSYATVMTGFGFDTRNQPPTTKVITPGSAVAFATITPGLSTTAAYTTTTKFYMDFEYGAGTGNYGISGGYAEVVVCVSGSGGAATIIGATPAVLYSVFATGAYAVTAAFTTTIASNVVSVKVNLTVSGALGNVTVVTRSETLGFGTSTVALL